MKSFRKTTKLYSWITQTHRSCVEIEWSKESLSHNIFRVFELLAGRKYGIRCEVSFSADENFQFVEYHTFEAMCGFFEQRIRQFLKGITPKIVKVYIPVFAYAGVPKSTQKPAYLFAIAFDATNADSDPGNGTASASFTVSGSERGMVAYGANGPGAINTAEWNSTESLTEEIRTFNNPYGYMWWLIAPSTGAHALTMTGNGTKAIAGASYTGLNQTAFVDATNTATQSSDPNTGDTLSLTVVASDCWIVAGHMNTQNRSPSISSYSSRSGASADGAEAYIFDSNGTVSTGSNNIVYSWSNSSGNKMMVMSIKPPTPIANSSFLMFM